MSKVSDLIYPNAVLSTIEPVRCEATRPHTFRIAQYPDGELRVQGAYAWTKGLEGGETWRDLPVVEVDENGVAL